MRIDNTATQPLITATAQQSRFHAATFDAGANIDVELFNVTLTIGGLDVLEGANITLRNGVRYGLTGRNGCGKSTVLQALVDRLIPGIPPSLKMHLVTQVDPGPAEGDITVLQYVLDGHVERKKALEERDVLTRALESGEPVESQRLLDQIMHHRAQADLEDKRRTALRRSGARGKEARAEEIKAEEALEEARKRLEACVVTDDWSVRATELLSEVQSMLELLDVNGTEAQARRILRGLGFSTKKIEGKYNKLSGGWRSRCRLATALLVQVDLLMLDEPSNFMDLESVLFLEQYLLTSTSYSILLLTSHDQVFLDRLAEKTIALRHNRLDYFDGTPSLMVRTEEEEKRSKEKGKDAMDKKKEHIEASIAQGRKTAKATGDDNRMRMVKARTKKLEDRWGIERSAKGTRFKLNRDLPGYHQTSRAAIEIEGPEKAAVIRLPEAPALKTLGSLFSIEGVSVGYKGKAVVEGVTITLHQGGRVALVGANGQGKSTLVKAIMGELSPLKGSINRHPSVKIGYFSQHAVEELKEHETISALEYFMEFLESRGQATTEADARSVLGRVGLGAAAKVAIGGMSGGQKVRLALATVLATSPNLLVLDEVTTHLDAPTIRALAGALTDYKGGILLISHDRWFSSVVVEGKPMDEDSSSSSSDNGDDGLAEPGQTWLVDKGTIKVLARGMEQYEELVEKRLRKRAKKEGWDLA